MLRTTLIGGLIFLVPVIFVLFVLSQAYQYSLILARLISRVIQLETIAGVVLAEILAILLILGLCFVAGLIAKLAYLRRNVDRLDGVLLDLIPGYAIVKSTLHGVAQGESGLATLKPVLVRLDDFEQIAFEVERSETRVTVFLPGAPSTWAGTVGQFEPERVRPINLPLHQVIKVQRLLGRGSAAALATMETASETTSAG